MTVGSQKTRMCHQSSRSQAASAALSGRMSRRAHQVLVTRLRGPEGKPHLGGTGSLLAEQPLPRYLVSLGSPGLSLADPVRGPAQSGSPRCRPGAGSINRSEAPKGSPSEGRQAAYLGGFTP